MLAAIALIPILLAVAVALSSERLAPGEGPPFLAQVTQNGLFTGFTAMLLALPLFLPLTVSVVAGDTIAGEAGLGTLRYLLISPVGRVRLLVMKYLASLVFILAGTFTLMIAGAAIGAILFPVGPVTLLSGVTISIFEAMAAVGLFISTLTTVPVGAMTATLVTSGVSNILGNIPQLEWMHSWLFTYYWLDFADLLRAPIEWGSMANNLVLQLGWIAVFGSLAYGRFTTKDILS